LGNKGISRRRGPGGQAAALALSLVAHAVVLLALLWRVAPLPVPATTPATYQARTPRPSSAPPPTETIPAISPAPAVPAPPAPTPSMAPPTDGARLRGALQSALGCRESANLSPEQRRACQERLAQALAARAQKSFGMDPARRAAFAEEAREREPFLARTPKDNCVPRLEEKEIGRGAMATHDWKGGVACAKAF
jgi:colicin import membrane protein